MRSCLSVEECLSYVEDTSLPLPISEVHRHIDECSACRIALGEAASEAVPSIPRSSSSRAAMTLVLGERIAERYEVRRFIAKGGMGEVYEAFDLALSETVALKTLALTTTDQAEAAKRFLEEVRLARKVTHPNVCRILEFGIHRRTGRTREIVPFLTMALLQGETLSQALQRQHHLDVQVTSAILRDLLRGLNAIHAADIVHRDLKTENVFLVTRGNDSMRATVMDFGLARNVGLEESSLASSPRAVVGTLAYMAPEQLQARPATRRSDIYSVGVIAFELLTGRLPFVAESPIEAAAQKLVTPAPRVSRFAPHLGRQWDDIVGRCLERNPNGRPATVDAVLAALSAADLPRPRLRASAVAGLALCAGVLFIGTEMQPKRARSAAPLPSPDRTPTPTSPVSVSVTSVPASLEGDAALSRAPSRRRSRTSPASTLRLASAGKVEQVVERSTDAPGSAGPLPVDDPLAPARPHIPHGDDLINPF